MVLDKLFATRNTGEVHEWFSGRGAELLKELGVKSGDHVLDFGCGIGSYAAPLAQITGKNGSVTIVDKDQKKLRATREQCSLWAPDAHLNEVCCSGGESLSVIPDDSLDAVLVFDVLQHVKNWRKLFSNVVRVLRSGGHVLINPSLLSHAGKVKADELLSVLERQNIHVLARRKCHIMHYKHFAEDEIWVCEVEP